MNEIYDSIAEDYSDIKSWYMFKVYDYSMLEAVGTVKDKSVLDLACGEGHLTRILYDMGCRDLTGVDISREMIKLAEAKEQKLKQGIKYICKDVLKLGVLGAFDIITAAFLLHYAENKEELSTFCREICSNLKKGGRFITMHPGGSAKKLEYDFSRFEFNFKVQKSPQPEEAPFTVMLFPNGKLVEFDVNFYTKKTYTNSLLSAGFSQVIYHKIKIPESKIPKIRLDTLKEYPDLSAILVIECIK